MCIRDRFIPLEIVGDFFNHQIIVGDNIPQIQGNHHGATGPVSYTHLDVYKRQAQYLVNIEQLLNYQNQVDWGNSFQQGLNILEILLSKGAGEKNFVLAQTW